MAPVPASINLNWISNYVAGCHHVCYGLDPTYIGATCFDVSCAVGVGQPCSTTIPITVDNESCDPVTYYGYVQACCEAPGSPTGRIPFTITFTPVPTCTSVNFDCNKTGLQSIPVTNEGCGYNPGVPPVVTISGGGGAGATAVAVVGNGGFDTYALTNAGAGLTNGTYLAIPATTVTGVGVAATFDVTVAGNIITAVTNVAPGTGYAIGDTVKFATIVGTGAERVTVSTVDTGEVLSITITGAGTNYSSLPVVSIAASPGMGGCLVNAVLGTPVMIPCNGFDLGVNCATDSIGVTNDINVGESFDICYTGGVAGAPTPPAEYTVAASALCCFDCETIVIVQPNSGPASCNVFYQDCTTGLLVNLTVLINTTTTVCARRHSYGSDSLLTVITPGAVCP